MSLKLKTGTSRRLLAVAMAAAVLATLLAVAVPALAQDAVPQVPVTDLLNQLQAAQVEGDVCTSLCHANIAATKNFSSEIIFSHGNHLVLQCSDCHPRFPHQKSGTERPTMKGCFNCHGLRHGSMGIIAKDACPACHNSPRWQMKCPFSDTPDWAGKGHVKQGETDVNKNCMMCHKTPECTECHDRTGVVWQPKNGWDYDPGAVSNPKTGCYACHGDASLLKASGTGTKSFQVTGVEDSVHADITCQQCHPDFRYDDKPAMTKMWTVNAGLQCGTCHQTLKVEKDRVVVAQYEESVHAQKLRDGNNDSATCGSCHGGHFIYALDTAENKARMHSSAYRTCARCKQHGEAYATYNDYYHGRAYKKGAGDAPACWECHEAHKVLPKNDPASTVHATNLDTTCGQKGCHKGSTEQFGAQASQLIHRKVQAQEQNPLLQMISKVKGMVGL